MDPQINQTNREEESFLPQFCNVRIVFSVIIIAELLAFVLTLATPSASGGDWAYLSMVSLYIQWIALVSTAVLCSLRPWLARLNNSSAGVATFIVLLATAGVMGEVAFHLSRNLGGGVLAIEMSHGEFFLRNLAICAIGGLLALRYFYLQHQLKRNIESEHRAHLQVLRARIRPHFLFNALNTIASLIRRHPRQAEEAVENLADLFRHSLNNNEVLLSFAEELEISHRYLEMEKLRLGERLKLDWQIDELPGDAGLPALTLQPLLENAICHGIEPLPLGGTIEVHGQRRGQCLSLTIRNPLPGENQASERRRQGLHIAVDLIRKRLRAHFDDEGKLTSRRENDYYQVELHFPYQPIHEHSDRR